MNPPEVDFEVLIQLIYAGNWLVNGPSQDRIAEFDDGTSRVHSKSDKAGLGDHVYYEKEAERYFPDGKLEQAMAEFTNDYENDAFWD